MSRGGDRSDQRARPTPATLRALPARTPAARAAEPGRSERGELRPATVERVAAFLEEGRGRWPAPTSVEARTPGVQVESD